MTDLIFNIVSAINHKIICVNYMYRINHHTKHLHYIRQTTLHLHLLYDDIAVAHDNSQAAALDIELAGFPEHVLLSNIELQSGPNECFPDPCSSALLVLGSSSGIGDGIDADTHIYHVAILNGAEVDHSDGAEPGRCRNISIVEMGKGDQSVTTGIR